MTTPAETTMLEELTAFVADLHASGTEDGETMFILGASADRLCSLRDSQTWTGFKSTLSAPDIIALLRQIDAEGNEALQADKGRLAYVLRALALSLTSTKAKQDVTKAGAALLDQVIGAAVTNYRTHAKSTQDAI